MSKDLKACFSRNTDDWKIPSLIYNAFMEKDFIDCFPFKASFNQLNILYLDKKLFINPPFSKLNEYVYWIVDQIGAGNKVALLIPSRTDTIYFHQLLSCNPVIIFIKGRLRYNDSNCAPFPTLLMLFNFCVPKTYSFMDQQNLISFIRNTL